MTLPFRRRHHDSESGHDRARTLMSDELLAPIGEDDEAWLARHVDMCAECRRDRLDYGENREVLRSLRESPPEPPRDLWARTSAALDREARQRPAAAGGGSRQGLWRGFPLGAAAGVVVLLVVLGSRLMQPLAPPSATTPGNSAVAVVPTSRAIEPTPITIDTNTEPVGFVRTASDGSFEVVFSNVDEVCPSSVPECPPIDEEPARPVQLASKPSKMTISPHADQLVVEPGDALGPSGRILVVPVPDATPAATEGPSAGPVTSGPPTVEPSAPASTEPSDQPSLGPTPEPTPEGQIEIASGVTIVGDLAYSEDGKWLAFSARPIDGSAGPDLYLWAVGSPSATAVTSDHRTYFSAWLGNQVLASRVVLDAVPAASGEPATSDEPAASDQPLASEPAASTDVEASPATPAPIVGHPVSFLFDPASLTGTDLSRPDVWLPVVDAGGRVAAYWSGTVRSSDGLSWTLDAGQLVLDAWSTGAGTPAAESTAEPAVTSGPEETSAPLGPTGAATPIVAGQTGAFRARFDHQGTRLAVWVAEQAGDQVGRLHLLVVDPEAGTLGTTPSPLQEEPALAAFSIDDNRLAWVTPAGQDGQQSAVKILGWSDSEFGEIQTRPGEDLYIVR